MGLILHIVLGVFHLAVVIIEIATLFLVARVLAGRLPYRWLRAVADCGRPFTDPLLNAAGRLFRRVHPAMPRDDPAALSCIGLLLVIRLAIGWVAAACV